MQAFFLSLANLIAKAWEFLQNMFQSFLALLDYLYSSVEFVLKCIARLPEVVAVPCTVILGVMIVKFILSFGKQ